MARYLYLDMPSGAAGDMLLAALCDLGFDLSGLQAALEAMELGDVALSLDTVDVGALRARRFRVEEKSPSSHHRSFKAIRDLLQRAGLTPAVHARVLAMFTRLAQAEAKAHGVELDQVHFHEVGAVDSIADLLGLAMALEALGVERVGASVPVLGHGLIDSQHGPLPLPAPATLYCLQGKPVRRLDLEAELTTPTAACFLATQVDHFGPAPSMVLERVGMGAGSRNLPDRPNVLRAWLGETDSLASNREWQIQANVDDMPGEQLAYLMERLLEAGALDVWFTPVNMKKSRPGVMLGLLCEEDRRFDLEGILLAESSSLGLRRWAVARRKLVRRVVTVATPHGKIRVKVGELGDGEQKAAPEFEDCRRLALELGLPLRVIDEAARLAWRDGKVLSSDESLEGS